MKNDSYSQRPLLVIGASLKPERASYTCLEMANHYNVPTHAIGSKSGKHGQIEITTERPQLDGVHTVSLYLRAELQHDYESYILGLNPKRIIFNPGAENSQLFNLAVTQGIEAVNACNLVMFRLGEY